jgi:hypothetical protein
MSNDATWRWLMEIAEAVERWSMTPRDHVRAAMATDTPVGAMLYLASKVPPEERAAVHAALPIIATDDFAEAAQKIRQAAGPLPSGTE